MRIQRKDLIGGTPAIAVRNFLRKQDVGQFNAESAMHVLRLSKEEATRFMDTIESIGLVEWSGRKSEVHPGFILTPAGRRFAKATAAKPVSRNIAGKRLEELVKRATNVNANKKYAYVVQSIVVFGSFLTEKEMINDVDVAVELAPRYKDSEKFKALSEKRVEIAYQSGRNFGHLLEQLDWPRREVILILKNRSRTLSIEEFGQLSRMEGLVYKVLMGDESKLAELLKNGRMVR
jgi:predicted nucleotidyltransferase